RRSLHNARMQQLAYESSRFHRRFNPTLSVSLSRNCGTCDTFHGTENPSTIRLRRKQQCAFAANKFFLPFVIDQVTIASMSSLLLARDKCIATAGGVVVFVQLGIALSLCRALENGGAEPPPKNDLVSFSRDVAPIFSRKCVTCHGAEKSKSKYRLDS